ncbi:DASH complex subunit Ask1-domain-containing protein [Podospora australis]|uniref:DASH complex subunit ASK1 n=1 Tax=Podospora australis TaxID=1536484 RepID=A0AAN7APQ7_9PEZI|nr:DASH complex subunit Ask1-domain-containing protein [Podospora australis]
MSRPSSVVGGRPLTLTEELEKLEQSITLTLQEIDHNFSKAHRIVTTSILPLVEQYGEHSRNVWEASKFWKQFFEASANVSLSGYEELANNNNQPEETTVMTSQDETTVDETTAQYSTPRPRDHDSVPHDNANQSSVLYHGGKNQDETSVLSDNDGDITGSTPRPPATKTIKMAGFSSPYEALRREYQSKQTGGSTTPAGGPPATEEVFDQEDDTSLLFQQHTARLPDMSMTPRQSLGAQESEEDDDLGFLKKPANTKTNKDPLLHRLQDKNYRIMATPHKGGLGATGVTPLKWKVTADTKPKPLATTPAKGKETRPIWQDSPMSSPEIAMPQLRSAAFMSPVKAASYTRGAKAAAASAAANAPRTPGVSVQTPGVRGGGKTKDVYGQRQEERDYGKQGGKYADEIGWSESDEDDLGTFEGVSPPKTIQFALPPSKLLQTPAREASKRIVDNILLTAGEDLEDDDEEYSPTVVKVNHDLLDDTF